jgi:hypothetical protein
MAIHEVYRWDHSRSRMFSRMGSCQTIGFSSVIEDATIQEDWREGFSLVIEGETNQMNWK